MPIVLTVYRLVCACWFGGAVLFTFVLTPTIFASFSRDMAGGIVGVLFPGYFYWGMACGAVALFCLLFSGSERRRLPVWVLALMLIITAAQAFVIEPQAAQLKREIPSFATTSADHPLRRQFRRLHGISATGNLVVIAGGALLVIKLPNGRRRGEKSPFS